VPTKVPPKTLDKKKTFFFVKSKTLDILPKTLDKTKNNLSHRKRWIFLKLFFVKSKTLDI